MVDVGTTLICPRSQIHTLYLDSLLCQSCFIFSIIISTAIVANLGSSWIWLYSIPKLPTDQFICETVVAKYLWHLTDNHWKIYDFGSTKTLCLKSIACNPLGCCLNSGYEIPSWRVNIIIHWRSFIKYWFTLALEFHYYCFETILGGDEFVSHYVEKIRS